MVAKIWYIWLVKSNDIEYAKDTRTTNNGTRGEGKTFRETKDLFRASSFSMRQKSDNLWYDDRFSRERI